VVGGWADPAALARIPLDTVTTLDMLRANSSIKWRPASGSNDFGLRREAVTGLLNRLVDGRPALAISQRARCCVPASPESTTSAQHRVGLNDSTTGEIPVKKEWSHPMDALGYLLIGGGELGVIATKVAREQRAGGGVRIASGVDYDPLNAPAPQRGGSGANVDLNGPRRGSWGAIRPGHFK
jgi:hypothetical protein